MQPRLQLEFVLKAGFLFRLVYIRTGKRQLPTAAKLLPVRGGLAALCDLQIFLTGHAGEMSVRASATK